MQAVSAPGLPNAVKPKIKVWGILARANIWKWPE